MKKYLRLLTYENACRAIDFINQNDKDDYAHIVPGGVSVDAKTENWEAIENFIKSLDCRYEITIEQPDTIHKKIVATLKDGGLIK